MIAVFDKFQFYKVRLKQMAELTHAQSEEYFNSTKFD